MRLYHGSPCIVRCPELSKGRLTNDYGQGFYCTEDIELAREWACGNAQDGFTNEYELDCSELNLLHLVQPDYTVLNWLALLLRHRTIRASTPTMRQGIEYLVGRFMPDISSYDVIMGYRADDSYFSFARAFVNNEISLKQLSYAMKLGNLGEQVVLKTEKAFDNLTFVEAKHVDAREYFPRRTARDEMARTAYVRELERVDRGGIFIRTILDEGVGPDDARVQ